MWLIHTENRQLECFISDDDIPPYAILSHTWGSEEVTLQEWRSESHSRLEHKQGYQKILACLIQARQDGLDWAWIDTCCIDKTSSAELSEAINSMFRWYKQSVVCYAFLADVSHYGHGPVDLESCRFAASRWFTRGWTLQELIAPSNLVFWSSNWRRIGTKDELQVNLSTITGIEAQYLCATDLDLASTAKKMSWAAHRQTSREEDRAYSLLGIFDVNIPLIYGEGKKAFQRLQAEILRVKPEDHSIFAWGKFVGECSFSIRDRTPVTTVRNYFGPPPAPLLGLLAGSPLDFADSGKIIPLPWASRFYTNFYVDWVGAGFPSVVGSAVRIELPASTDTHNRFRYTYEYPSINPAITQARPGICAGLLCATEEYPRAKVYIPLLYWGPGYTGRTREIVIDRSTELPETQVLRHFRTKAHFHVVPERRVTPLSVGDIVIRQKRDLRTRPTSTMFDFAASGSTLDWDRIIRPCDSVPARLFAIQMDLFIVGHENAHLVVVFGRCPRVAHNRDPDHNLYVGILVYLDGEFTHEEAFAWDSKPDPEYIFAAPIDHWTLDLPPLPLIKILVERKRSTNSPGFYVDVVDIVVRDPVWRPTI